MSGWRRWCSRWSGAEAALVAAWGAPAAGLLAVALRRESAGVLAIAAFCAWQMSDVWSAVHGERRSAGDAERERDPRRASL